MKSPKAKDVRRGISALWDTLQCPICLELMTTPVSTKCDHQFCKFCMHKLIDGNKQRETQCPVCKTKITKRSLQESPGFQRLITGLRNMIAAYENDTRTSYFTGMSLQRRQQSVAEAEGSTVLSEDASDNHHDNGGREEHGLPGSHSSTIEAQNGFASLMDLKDSSCFMAINDGLDTSFSETPQTAGEKSHVHVGINPTVGPGMERELAEVVEKATSRPRTRGKKRLATLENPPSRLSLVPDEDQRQPAPKDNAARGTESPEKRQKLQRQKTKSLEKVSRWLLQVPLVEDLQSEVDLDAASGPECHPASPAGSSLSDSTKIIRHAKPEPNRKAEEPVKSLEDQVFGIVYSRRGRRSFSPPQRPLGLVSRDPSSADEEHGHEADAGEGSEPLPGDYAMKSNSDADDDDGGAEGVVEVQAQTTNEQCSDTAMDVSEELRAWNPDSNVNEIGKHQEQSEEPPLQEGEENHVEGEASSPAFNTAVLQLERRSANQTVMEDNDADLQKQTMEKQETAAKGRAGWRKGKNTKRQNGKAARGRKPVVLVSALGEEAASETPRSRLGCGEEHIQVETCPSGKMAAVTEARGTRGARTRQITAETQEGFAGKLPGKKPMSTRRLTAKGPKDDNLDQPSGNILLDDVTQSAVNVTKRNGCICDEDIGGIEQIGSTEASGTYLNVTEVVAQTTASIVEVPDTVSPRGASAPCFTPVAATRGSPTEAALPSPAPEGVKPANRNAALSEDSAARIERAEAEEDVGVSDSEVDTEQLMKSFKVAKRKSFHLGSPKGKQSVVGSDKRPPDSKAKNNCGSGAEHVTNQISKATEESTTVQSETSPEIEKSSCGDVVASAKSPSRHTSLSGVRPRRGLRRRLGQPEEVFQLDSTTLTKCQDTAEGGLSGNTGYSALSPNKAAKSQTQSLHCTLAPDTAESVQLFSALEVAEDGSLGVASRSTKRCKAQQPTKRMLEAITLPKTRPGIATDASGTRGNTDNSVVITNESITPDGLVPPVVGSPDSGPASCDPSAGSPVKTDTVRKRKAQRLESSSESSEEELPSLAQLFKCHPPEVPRDRAEGQDEAPGGLGTASGCGESGLCPPSPDCEDFSQASVDLFDTPAECDIAAIDTGVSMDSSQFSSDLLVTQQKQAMQKELLRLGNLMALVTEVLQEKEDGSTTELPVDQTSTGHDLSTPCDQEVKQTTSDPAPIETRDSVSPPSSPANHVEATPPPRPWRRGNTAETAPQTSTTTRPSTRFSGDPRAPSSPGSKVKSTKVKTQPPPAAAAAALVLDTREALAGDQVTRSTSTPDPADGTRQKPERVFVSSGLGSNEQVMVKKFAKRIGARVVPQVTPEVTHVIMCTDEGLVCERTLKYFLGIAGRKWVVSFLWISECFKQGELLDEVAFEVRGDVVNGADHGGPLRARGTRDQDLLMKGYRICFQGCFADMTTDQMQWMAELCGASVVKDPRGFDSGKRAHQLLIVQPGRETARTAPSALSRRATVVNRGWLLDSVATYTLQNPGDYRT